MTSKPESFFAPIDRLRLERFKRKIYRREWVWAVHFPVGRAVLWKAVRQAIKEGYYVGCVVTRAPGVTVWDAFGVYRRGVVYGERPTSDYALAVWRAHEACTYENMEYEGECVRCGRSPRRCRCKPWRPENYTDDGEEVTA